MSNFYNRIAQTSNANIPLPRWLMKRVAGGKRDYSSLPDIFTMADGSHVDGPELMALRRREILKLFEREVYGPLPAVDFACEFSALEEGRAKNGALRRQMKITVKTQKGECSAVMLVHIPKSDTPVPVVLGLNFEGNHTVSTDEEILPSLACKASGEELKKTRGSQSERWSVDYLMERGVASATIFCGDFAPDDPEKYSGRFAALFEQREMKAVDTWAFGLMRAIDCLSGMKEIDCSRIALIGHSRLGKAALWAGANDERAALVISNASGNTGASFSRENRGETVKMINERFPYWFCSRYAELGENVNAMPVDQHMLLACIAPRKLYVACAQRDLWADPDGALNCLQRAKEAFALYGAEVIPDTNAQPPVGSELFSDSIGYHLRKGWHEVLHEDWVHYINYMEKYL